MKHLSIALLVALSTLAATPRPAAACGDYGVMPPARTTLALAATAVTPRETATGIWPSLRRESGRTLLRLAYPRFTQSGQWLYMDELQVVADRQLRRLERAIAGREHANLQVSVEQVRAGIWRVTGFAPRG